MKTVELLLVKASTNYKNLKLLENYFYDCFTT